MQRIDVRGYPLPLHPGLDIHTGATLSQRPPIFAARQLDNTLPHSDEPLEVARRQYLTRFVGRFPFVHQAWEAGGLTQSEDTYNIIEHHVVAGALGGILGRKIGLKPHQIEAVEYALLVHDADKLLESAALKRAAQKPKDAIRRKAATKTLYGGHTLLKNVGIPEDVVHLSTMIVPRHSSEPPSDIRAMIVHFMDAIMDGSHPKHVRDRMNSGANASGRRNSSITRLRDKAHEEELGIAEGTYRTVQVQLALKEAAYFCDLIAAQPNGERVEPEELHNKLKEWFDEEVRSAEKQHFS